MLWPTSSDASLEQLGDAWADVMTFGAWGQSRDTHQAEIAALNKRHEEEMKRLRNQSEALRLSEAIEQQRLRALDARYNGQQLLRVLSLIDVLIAQMKDEIANRYKVNQNISHFSQWFDSFVTGTNDNLEALVDLIRNSTNLDPESVEAVLKTAKIADVQRKRQIEQARAYLVESVSASRWDTLEKSIGTLYDVRLILTNLLETNRGILRSMVAKMASDDAARRALCDRDTVGITCDSQNKCKYYDAAGPGPCNDVVLLNVFPVSFVKAIFDDLGSYRLDAEFYVDLGRIGIEGTITKDASSTSAVFAKDLEQHPLIPPDFRMPRQCHDFKKLRVRLIEGIEYAQIFSNSEGVTKPIQSRIVWLRNNRRYITFSLDGLALSLKTEGGCNGVSNLTKSRLDNLESAVAAVETFGSAVTLDRQKDAAQRDLLKPLETIANDL